MRAGRGPHQGNALWIEIERRGFAAHELHRRTDVVDRLRIGFSAFAGEPVADRVERIAARREIRAPILKR
jgi:hypothetical protein